MKTSKLSLLLVVFLPAVSLAGIGCAPVFSDLQSAKLAGRNHHEFTASATRVSLSSNDSQAPAPLRTPDTMSLSGPRIGVTFLSDGVARKLLENDIEVGSFVSQFGWQKERRFLSSDNGATAVTEWILLVGGIDQGLFLPSLSWLVGFRTAKGIEFAVGPNLTPVGSAIAAAAGMTLRVGNLNVPVNLAVVPSKSGVRVSLLAGFNARR